MTRIDNIAYAVVVVVTALGVVAASTPILV